MKDEMNESDLQELRLHYHKYPLDLFTPSLAAKALGLPVDAVFHATLDIISAARVEIEASE